MASLRSPLRGRPRAVAALLAAAATLSALLVWLFAPAALADSSRADERGQVGARHAESDDDEDDDDGGGRRRAGGRRQKGEGRRSSSGQRPSRGSGQRTNRARNDDDDAGDDDDDDRPRSRASGGSRSNPPRSRRRPAGTPAAPAPSRPRSSPRRSPATSGGGTPAARPRRATGRGPAAGTAPRARGRRSGRGTRTSDVGGALARGATSLRLGRGLLASPLAALGGAPGSAGDDASTGSGGRTRGSSETERDARRTNARARDGDSPVVRTVRDIVEVVPDSIKAALAALAALVVMLAAGSAFSALSARRLNRQRGELREEVGLLQAALLPPVPGTLGALRTSVAYRPADGPGAGGDFYDAFSLGDGRAGLILGDVSGHGQEALAHTAFMRYTLRAYLEAGLEPRKALQVAGRVIGEQLGDDFATVLVAVHDAVAGSLVYAGAGHPPPLLAGSSTYEPVTAASSPPIGVGARTGQRQTSLPLAPGTVACLYTDGLVEAKTADGILGRDRLARMLAELGPDADARELIDRVAREAREVPDDMAACLVSPESGLTAGGFRAEQLELDRDDLRRAIAPRFLAGCGVPAQGVARALAEARDCAERSGGAVLTVTYGNRGRRVGVLPRNVEGLEAVSRRAAAH